MILESLKIENFMSLKDTEIAFPSKGVFSIRGRVEGQDISSNGAGKSAMVEAIFWTLYGRTLRGTTSDKSWGVTITGKLLDGKRFQIHRTKADIDVSIDGVETEAYLKTDKQKIIDAVILKNTSWNTFSLLSYFTPFTITNWFIKMTDTDRKNVLLEVLNLSWLDSIYEKVKQDIAEVQAKINTDEMEISRIEGYIKGIQSTLTTSMDIHLEELVMLISRLQKDYSLDFLPLQKDNYLNVDFLQQKLVEVDDYKSRANAILSEVNAKLSILFSEKSALNTELSNISRQKAFLTNNSECPTCHRPLDEEYRSQMLEDLQKREQELRQKFPEIEERHRALTQEQTLINDLINLLSSIFYKLHTIKQLLISRQDNFKDMGELEKKLETLKTEITNYKEELNQLNLWKLVFSSTGVKADVIEDIFSRIMERTALYAGLLGIEFKQKIRKGRIKYENYKSLSSGERRRAEISLLFALRDIIPIPSKFLVIDEVFDHLDNAGLQSILPLLEAVSEDSQVFVISHRPDLILPKVDKDIIVEKIKGVSKIHDYSL